MFVFPAFDTNYMTRKRAFHCCQNCRLKRVKCESVTDGSRRLSCVNCQNHGWVCDLEEKEETTSKRQTPEPISKQKNKSQPSVMTLLVPEIPEQTSLVTSSSKIVTPILDDDAELTPEYLKRKFNFNLSRDDSVSKYTFMYHNHPEAILSGDSNETKAWRQSGVFIRKPEKTLTKIMAMRRYKDRNRHLLNYLTSINGFTLRNPYFPIEPHEEKRLLQLFFFKINSIFPYVIEKMFWDEYRQGNVQTVYIFAMVLLILRDNMAKPILREIFMRAEKISDMSDESYNEAHLEFIIDLDLKIRQLLVVLPTIGDYNRLTRLVVLLMLTMQLGTDKVSGEQTSQDLVSALSLSHSLGIHMKRQNNDLPPELVEYSTNLWWICFILDRINAAVNSRAVFIQELDFNVDPPYKNIALLKLVQAAKNFELMNFAVYRPYQDTVSVNSDEFRYRSRLFNVQEFQEQELDLCRKERSNVEAGIQERLYRFPVGKYKFEDLSPGLYVEDTVYYMLRMWNNAVLMIALKAKLDDPSETRDGLAGSASEAAYNIFWYHSKIKPDFIVNIPMIPFCLFLALGVCLKREASRIISYGSAYDEANTGFDMSANDVIQALEAYASTSWVVDEMCKLSREFLRDLNYRVGHRKDDDSTHSSKRPRLAGTPGEFKSSLRINGTPSNERMNKTSPMTQRSLLESPAGVDNPSLFNVGSALSDEQQGKVFERDLPNFWDYYDNYMDLVLQDVLDNEYFKDISNIMTPKDLAKNGDA